MTTALVLTTAPSAYDYGYTQELATGLTVEQYEGQTNPPSNVRLVAMPSESADYQRGRYHSGMYFTTTAVGSWPGTITKGAGEATIAHCQVTLRDELVEQGWSIGDAWAEAQRCHPFAGAS